MISNPVVFANTYNATSTNTNVSFNCPTNGQGNIVNFTGPITMLGANQVQLSVTTLFSTYTFSGPISGSGTLMAVSGGLFTLPNANPNWTGGLAINGPNVLLGNAAAAGTGTLVLSNAGTLLSSIWR